MKLSQKLSQNVNYYLAILLITIEEIVFQRCKNHFNTFNYNWERMIILMELILIW